MLTTHLPPIGHQCSRPLGPVPVGATLSLARASTTAAGAGDRHHRDNGERAHASGARRHEADREQTEHWVG